MCHGSFDFCCSIEEECAVSSCTSTLQTKNMELHKSLKRLNSVFNKLDTITSLLAAQSKKFYMLFMVAQRFTGRVLDSRQKGSGFEPHLGHCVVSLSKNINPSLVLVQPRKTRLCLTERLLMGHKESNLTKQTNFFIQPLVLPMALMPRVI